MSDSVERCRLLARTIRGEITERDKKQLYAEWACIVQETIDKTYEDITFYGLA